MAFIRPRKPKMRFFSLYGDRYGNEKRGGSSGFKNFLRTLGKMSRPVLKKLEHSIGNVISDKLGRRAATNAVQLGSNMLGDLVEKKARDFMERGKKHINDKLFGAGQSSSYLPADIDKHLFPENRKKIAKLFGKKKRATKRKGGRQQGGNKRQTPAKKRKGGRGGGRKRASRVGKGKGGARKRRSKKAGVKGGGGRKKATPAGRKRGGGVAKTRPKRNRNETETRPKTKVKQSNIFD